VQYGPGAENAFPGVATAYSGSTPMLLLPLGHPRDRAQVFPLFSSARTCASVTKSVEIVASHDKYGARDIGGRYADLGRAMGGWSERVERPVEIAGAFARARRATERGQAASTTSTPKAATGTATSSEGSAPPFRYRSGRRRRASRRPRATRMPKRMASGRGGQPGM
jgi:thiamine pyrophosphate-dependent acetolactate synthase large subunit-like protein